MCEKPRRHLRPAELTPVMNISLLSGVTLTSNVPGGSLRSRMYAGFCFISYARHTSLIARVNCHRQQNSGKTPPTEIREGDKIGNNARKRSGAASSTNYCHPSLMRTTYASNFQVMILSQGND